MRFSNSSSRSACLWGRCSNAVDRDWLEARMVAVLNLLTAPLPTLTARGRNESLRISTTIHLQERPLRPRRQLGWFSSAYC